MRLKGRSFSTAEDRFEAWIGQHHQERVLAGEITATGPCPDDEFLWDLARKSRRIDLSDPRVDHVASCPICMNRLLAVRAQTRSRRRRLALTTVVVACFAIAAVFIVLARYGNHNQMPGTNLAVVRETVNLWNAGTIRGGQPNPLQSVSLPAARVRLTLILPRFSEPGKYMVAVTHDRNGSTVIAEGVAMSLQNGNYAAVSVELDLRHAAAGKYFLATTHEQDQSSYYYPLQIR